jgi:hypothetical protein
VNEPVETKTQGTASPVSEPLRAVEIPLSTLLKNYVLVLLKDQRNFIILVLGALVVFLALNMDTTSKMHTLDMVAVNSLPESVHTIAVTTTATATTTVLSFSTLTVTEVQTAASMRATALPVSQGLGVQEIVDVAEDFALPTSSVDIEAVESTQEEEVLEPSEPVSSIVEDLNTLAPAPSMDESKSSSQEISEAQTPDDICVSEHIFQAAPLSCAA